MRKIIRQALATLQFLTILPLSSSPLIKEEELSQTLAFFPLVGFFIGCLLLSLNWFLHGLVPDSIINLLLIIFLVVITGGMHLDGFADMMDGFGAGRDKEGTLKIMKDTNLGVFGVAGIIFLIFLKFLILNNFPRSMKASYLLIFPALSRLAMVQLAFLSRYAREDDGLGKAFMNSRSQKGFWFSTLTGFFLTYSILGSKGVFIMIALLIFVGLFARYSAYRIGGVTGDVLGAANEFSEVFVLFCGMILESGDKIGILDKLGIT